MLNENVNPPAIHGEVVAGRSAAVKSQLEHLNELLTDSTFDLAELLAEVKGGNYHSAWGYESFTDYVEKVLDMKLRKAQYLIAIVNVSKLLHIPRSSYETIKITKLREIFSLKPEEFFFNPETNQQEPLDGHIKRLVSAANDMSLKAIVEEVKRLKGLVGEDEMVWMNTSVKRIVRDEVILPAIELARQRLGSQGKDAEGDAVEYSAGAALEVICADFLSDPNNTSDDSEELSMEDVLSGSMDVPDSDTI